MKLRLPDNVAAPSRDVIRTSYIDVILTSYWSGKYVLTTFWWCFNDVFKWVKGRHIYVKSLIIRLLHVMKSRFHDVIAPSRDVIRTSYIDVILTSYFTGKYVLTTFWWCFNDVFKWVKGRHIYVKSNLYVFFWSWNHVFKMTLVHYRATSVGRQTLT